MNQAVQGPDKLAYAYRPSLFGMPWEFRLGEHGIDWNAGAKSGHVPYASVRRVRMSFHPTSMQPRFVTEIWADGAPRLLFASTSRKSLVVREEAAARYAEFVAELHRRLAAAGVPARFEQGHRPWQYWPGFAIFALASLALAATVARALREQIWLGGAFAAAFLAIFLWRAGDYFRRNRPRLYRPDRLPSELMPKV